MLLLACRGLMKHPGARLRCPLTAITSRAWQSAKAAPLRKPESRPTPPSPKPFAGENNARDNVLSSQPAPFKGTRGRALLPPAPSTKEYPSQLLIYHAGNGIAIFVTSFKLLSIFIFIFSTLAIAPGYYFSPYEPTWMAAAVVAVGGLPMIFMVFLAPSYVTYIHLALPRWARLSQERLLHFARNLPSSAVLELTTVRWLWPRVTRLNASELHLKNYAGTSYMLHRKVPPEVYSARKWYGWRPVKSFLVAGRGGKVVEKGIWTEVLNCVHRGWVKRRSEI